MRGGDISAGVLFRESYPMLLACRCCRLVLKRATTRRASSAGEIAEGSPRMCLQTANGSESSLKAAEGPKASMEYFFYVAMGIPGRRARWGSYDNAHSRYAPLLSVVQIMVRKRHVMSEGSLKAAEGTKASMRILFLCCRGYTEPSGPLGRPR